MCCRSRDGCFARAAGCRATAASAVAQGEYQVPALAVTHDFERRDLRAMSHASAPTMNVAEMMQIQVLFERPRYSTAGVSAASVRQ